MRFKQRHKVMIKNVLKFELANFDFIFNSKHMKFKGIPIFITENPKSLF